MKINTKFFGELEIEESGVVEFIKPILAFEDKRKYVLLDGMDDLVFTFIQSVDDPQLCFLTIPPALVVKEYDIELGEEIVKFLELESPSDVLLYNIVSVPENVNDMTVNLKAPIVINMKNKKAAQEVLSDDKYSVKHRIQKDGE